MEHQQNRRAEDSPKVVERVVSLEANVAYIKNTLDSHIAEENGALHQLRAEVRAGQDKNDARMDGYEGSLSDVVQALRELTEQLKHLAPLGETYNDVRGAFRLISWFVTNAKTLAVVGACIYVSLNAPAVLKLLGV